MGYFNFENNVTPVNDTNLNAMQKGLMELVFPVGSTYITQSNTDPNTILGFGTWARLKGKVVLGVDENDNDLKTIGATGGSKTHKHDQTFEFVKSIKTGNGFAYTSGGTIPSENVETSEASNMMPYEVVGYMWIRRS